MSMYVQVHICTYTHTRTHNHTQTRPDKCTPTHTLVHTQIHTTLCVYTYICTEYMYMDIFLSIYACTYTDIYCNCIVGASACVLTDDVELSSSETRKPHTARETHRNSKLPWGSEFRTCQNLLTKDSWHSGLLRPTLLPQRPITRLDLSRCAKPTALRSA